MIEESNSSRPPQNCQRLLAAPATGEREGEMCTVRLQLRYAPGALKIPAKVLQLHLISKCVSFKAFQIVQEDIGSEK